MKDLLRRLTRTLVAANPFRLVDAIVKSVFGLCLEFALALLVKPSSRLCANIGLAALVKPVFMICSVIGFVMLFKPVLELRLAVGSENWVLTI